MQNVTQGLMHPRRKVDRRPSSHFRCKLEVSARLPLSDTLLRSWLCLDVVCIGAGVESWFVVAGLILDAARISGRGTGRNRGAVADISVKFNDDSPVVQVARPPSTHFIVCLFVFGFDFSVSFMVFRRFGFDRDSFGRRWFCVDSLF